MIKKRKLLLALSSLSVLGALSVALVHVVPSASSFKADPTPEHTLTLNSAPAVLTSSYQNSAKGTVTTSLGNSVELTFHNAKTLTNGFAQLANHGKIENFADTNSALTGIIGVSFTGSGSISFKPAARKGLLMEVDPISISAGGSAVVPSCDYFEIEAGDSGASINELSFTYSCDDSAYDSQSLNGSYTGIGNDGFTYKVVVADGYVNLVSLDKPSNVAFGGTVTMDSKTRATFTFPQFDYVVDYDGHSLNYVSKSGVMAPYVPQVSANRVYSVENFESYTATGTGYINANAKYTTTGLRSQFYADYYTGNGSGEIGGTGWPIMSSTDNSNYNSQKGHNSSKVGIFKFSNGMSMRYISMNELYGVKRLIGKGSTLSFWARGAYTNANFDTNHASNTTMKMYAYYDSPLTPSTQQTVRETFDFTVSAGATWQHFEFSLTSGRSYYGFGFYAQQSSGSTQYVPIDDIEIYTASPYAEPKISVTGVSLDVNNLNLEINDSTQLTATVTPSNASNKNVSWSSNNSSVATVNSSGVVTAVSEGNAMITVTTADGSYMDFCTVSVAAPAVVLNGTVTMTAYGTATLNSTAASVYGKSSINLLITLHGDSNSRVKVEVDGTDVTATDYTYDKNSGNLSITTTGTLGSFTVGTVTGVVHPALGNITNIACDGSISSYLTDNGSITCSETWFDRCNYSTNAASQQVWQRWYMSGGSWTANSGSGEWTTADSSHTLDNDYSMGLRIASKSFQKTRFTLKQDFNNGAGITPKGISIWLYNPNGNIYGTFKIFVYKSASTTSGDHAVPSSNYAEIYSTTAGIGNNEWKNIKLGMDQGTIYNVSFYFESSSSNNTYVNLGHVSFY